ncbi:cellulase family glycosylhydrolase [Streptomyces sp. NPDC054804]
MNWADPDDNFITGPNIPVGLSESDDYATVYTKSTAILRGFRSLGANTVRMGFNAATTSGIWWGSYTATLDAATALGMKVIVGPWLQNGKVSDTASFYRMWDAMINKYGSKSNFYFDIMNEPWAYNSTDLTDFEADWLAHHPGLSRNHVIVPGLWGDASLCGVGSGSRLSGTLLSIHTYSMFGVSHRGRLGQGLHRQRVRLRRPRRGDRVRRPDDHRRRLQRPQGRHQQHLLPLRHHRPRTQPRHRYGPVDRRQGSRPDPGPRAL